MHKIFKENVTILIISGALISLLFSCASTLTYHPPINDPIIKSEAQEDQVSILTYNIQTVFGKSTSKIDALLSYINREQYDFVLLQELFDEQVRNVILRNIDKGVYKSIVSRIDYDSFPENLFQDSGLFLMSRYPQVDLSHIRFDDKVSVTDGAIHMMLGKELSISTDFLANKSIMGSLHQINDSTYLFMFSTHLQAIGSKRHKRRQYQQIKDFIDYAIYAVLKTGTVALSKNMIVLLAGDFNTDAYDQQDLESLIDNLGAPRDLHGEFNPTRKEYTLIFKPINLYKRFDYIFAYDQAYSVPLKKVSVKSINVTDIKNQQKESISDHLAIKALLTFDEISNPSIEYHKKEQQAK